MRGLVPWIGCAVVLAACEGPPSLVDDPRGPDAGSVDAGPDAPMLPPLAPRLLYLAEGVLHMTTMGPSGQIESAARLSREGDVVTDFGWSPTARAAHYIAGTPAALFLITFDESGASEPLEVSRPIPPGVAGVLDAAFSPDGTALAYRVERVAGAADLYALPVEAPDVVTHVSVSGRVVSYRWSPSASAIAFLSPSYGQDELYIVGVSIDGEGVQPIVRERVSVRPPHPYGVADIAWSPDAEGILYRADQERHPMFTGQDNLYRATLDPWPPAEPQRVNSDLPSLDDDVEEMAWSPDGSWIAYRAAGSQVAVVLASADEPSPVEVAGSVLPNATIAAGLEFSPDSRWLTFFAAAPTTSIFELYALDLADGALAARRVNTALGAGQSLVVAGGGCPGARFATDGRALLYAGDERAVGQRELWAVDMSGEDPGAPVVVNGPLAADGAVSGCLARWSSDGGAVIYRAALSAGAAEQLFLVDASEMGGARAISGAAVAGGAVSESGWAFAPTDDAVAYLADERVDEQVELFVVGRQAGAVPARASVDLSPTGDVERFAWSPR